MRLLSLSLLFLATTANADSTCVPASLKFSISSDYAAANEQLQPIAVMIVDASGSVCSNDNASLVQLNFSNQRSDGDMMLVDGKFIGNGTISNVERAVNGIAIFSGISFNQGGYKNLLAIDGAPDRKLASDEHHFGISSFGSADHLRFSQQPFDTDDDGMNGNRDGRAWTTQPIVTVRDKFENIVSSDSSTVVSLDCVAPLTTPSCVLAGATKITVTNGTAHFSGLRLLNDNDDVNGIVIRAQSLIPNQLFSDMSETFNQDN